jgi:enamine deaminase RidA (YjgF/YER057c/UK114 family)
MTHPRCQLVALLMLAACASNMPAQAPVEYVEPNAQSGTSMAAVVGNLPLVHTAQLLPVNGQGKLVGVDDPAAQVEQVLANLEAALAEARSGLDRLVKVNVYVTRPETVDTVKKAFARKFPAAARPAVSFVAGKLAQPDALVALDAVAVSALDPGPAVKLLSSAKLHRSTGAHAAVLPAGARVYVSGQAEKGKDLAEATRRTLESLRATLKFLELTDAHVVQLKAFYHPVAQLGDVQAEVAKFFGDRPVPPLVFVEWTMPLPIEIELIAWAGKERDGEVIEYLTPPGVQASPIYSRVARINCGPSIFISGLYANQAKDAETEIQDVFATLGKLLEKTGSDLRHMAKATYYVSTDQTSRKLNELRPKYYDPRRPPAASKAVVPGVAAADRTLTLDMIAVPVKAGR